MATHSSTLAWRIPWREEPGGLQSMGLAKSQIGLSDFTFTFPSVKWKEHHLFCRVALLMRKSPQSSPSQDVGFMANFKVLSALGNALAPAFSSLRFFVSSLEARTKAQPPLPSVSRWVGCLHRQAFLLHPPSLPWYLWLPLVVLVILRHMYPLLAKILAFSACWSIIKKIQRQSLEEVER